MGDRKWEKRQIWGEGRRRTEEEVRRTKGGDLGLWMIKETKIVKQSKK